MKPHEHVETRAVPARPFLLRDQALEASAQFSAREIGEFPPTEAEESEQDDDHDDSPQRGVTEVDLTASVIEEASLLDEESSVLGEAIQPIEDTGPASRKLAQTDDDGD